MSNVLNWPVPTAVINLVSPTSMTEEMIRYMISKSVEENDIGYDGHTDLVVYHTKADDTDHAYFPNLYGVEEIWIFQASGCMEPS
jgi:hypothetical protein